MMDIDEKVQPPGTGLGIEEVFRTAGPLLWRSVYAFTGGRRDITEEAVAEAFARALAHADGIRDPVAWIYRTAHRLAARELRGERRTPPEARQLGPADDPRLDGILSALRRLPPRQRAAVVLHYQADLPVAEVARRLGISAATVKVHLFRGRQRLRTLLGSEEADDD